MRRSRKIKKTLGRKGKPRKNLEKIKENKEDHENIKENQGRTLRRSIKNQRRPWEDQGKPRKNLEKIKKNQERTMRRSRKIKEEP